MEKARLLMIGMSAVMLLGGCGKKDERSVEQQDRKEVAVLENNIIWENSEIREDEFITENVISEEGKITEEGTVIEEAIEGETVNFKNGLIFSTEYDIEDYCGGYFIVSKNDGLLYGVLDINGEEWIPCEYDEISFLNGNEYIDGKNDVLFMKLRYENLYTVMNDSGKVILDQVGGTSLEYADYEIGDGSTESAAFVVEYSLGEQDKGIRLYDQNGNALLEVEHNGVTMFEFETMISEGFFLAYSNLISADSRSVSDSPKVYLYDMQGTIVNQWRPPCYVDKYRGLNCKNGRYSECSVQNVGIICRKI